MFIAWYTDNVFFMGYQSDQGYYFYNPSNQKYFGLIVKVYFGKKVYFSGVKIHFEEAEDDQSQNTPLLGVLLL